jgi:hypothetical protein
MNQTEPAWPAAASPGDLLELRGPSDDGNGEPGTDAYPSIDANKRQVLVAAEELVGSFRGSGLTVARRIYRPKQPHEGWTKECQGRAARGLAGV